MIILEWNHDALDDIDLHVQDPTGDRASFRLPRVNFMHLDNVQQKIFKLQNQNSKLNVEIALLKSSPYIYDKAIALGMTDPDIDDE